MKHSVPLAFSLLISLVLALPAQGQDFESSLGGDICDTRPDLCGGSPAPKKKKKPQRTPSSATAARELELDIEGEFDEMSVEPMPERESARARTRTVKRPANTREPDLKKPLRITFESYVHSNAAHPAISRRPASMMMNQKAFVPPVVRTTITGSTLDQPAGTPGGPPATSAPANPASPAPEGPLR
jgi:hypothetical protein